MCKTLINKHLKCAKLTPESAEKDIGCTMSLLCSEIINVQNHQIQTMQGIYDFKRYWLYHVLALFRDHQCPESPDSDYARYLRFQKILVVPCPCFVPRSSMSRITRFRLCKVFTISKAKAAVVKAQKKAVVKVPKKAKLLKAENLIRVRKTTKPPRVV